MNGKLLIFFVILVILITFIITTHSKFAPLYDENKIYNISKRHNKNRNDACVKKTYGHYSQITKKFPSIFKFPLYYLSHPKTYVVNAGEYIYIPKNWWHWIITLSDNNVSYNLAYNYLIDTPINNSTPFCDKFIDDENLKKIHDTFNTTINTNKNTIKLWCDVSKNTNTTISDFISNKEKYKDCYLITLKIKLDIDDENENENHKIFKEFQNYIPTPDIVKNIKKNNTFFWLNNGNIDTGLHFDDNDGILCVLSGQKIITLFPPEDSKFLYSY